MQPSRCRSLSLSVVARWLTRCLSTPTPCLGELSLPALNPWPCLPCRASGPPVPCACAKSISITGSDLFRRAALSASSPFGEPVVSVPMGGSGSGIRSSSSANKRHRQAVSIGSEQASRVWGARWSVKEREHRKRLPLSSPLSSIHPRLGHRATRWCACLYNRARSEPKAKKHPTSFFPPPSPPESKSPGHCSPLAGRPSVVMRRAAQLHTRSLRPSPGRASAPRRVGSRTCQALALRVRAAETALVPHISRANSCVSPRRRPP